MGLDMYLYKRSYVKNWDHMGPAERHAITVTKGGEPTPIKPERISYIIEEVAYWRKANAIHRWFVEQVQEGKDDCGEYDVASDQLAELRDLCAKVLANRDKAADLLPAQSGFFFGPTDYNDYYFSDVQETHDTLTALLLESKYGDYQYHSSW